MDRDPRQHLVDERGGAFAHPPAPAARREAAALAEERHEALEITGLLSDPERLEPMGEMARDLVLATNSIEAVADRWRCCLDDLGGKRAEGDTWS